MRIIIDNQKNYRDDLLKHLRAYNEVYTGKKDAIEKYVYALDGKNLLGAIKLSMSWDWVCVAELFYQNINVLSSLLHEASNIFQSYSGIKFEVYTEDLKLDLETLEFIKLGEIVGTESIKTEQSYVNSNWNFEKQHYVISGAGIDSYNKILKEKQTEFNKQNNIYDYDKEVGFACFDGEQYAGGIIGIFRGNQMYIDLLVVHEDYRGKKIGEQLMKALEDYAVNLGITNMHVGTAEFQALGFYLKLGYELKVTIPNYPKGFECYELQKLI